MILYFVALRFTSEDRDQAYRGLIPMECTDHPAYPHWVWLLHQLSRLIWETIKLIKILPLKDVHLPKHAL